MALKLVRHTAGIAAALAVGLTAMGYIQAAQGLSERAEAALSSDALVVTAIDDWNAQHLTAFSQSRVGTGADETAHLINAIAQHHLASRVDDSDSHGILARSCEC